MDTIYHYCDLNAFISIIKNKELWLSATNNLNDHKEVEWLIRKFYNRLNELTNDKNKNLFNEFWQLNSINQTTPYICSFSKNSDLLSQWRAYTDDGYGLAIGFNRKYFRFKTNIPSPNVSSEMTIGISDVIYDEEIQNNIIEEIVKIIMTSLEDKQEKSQKLLTASTLLNKYSYVCKNPAFKEEDEVRIIHTPSILWDKKNNIEVRAGISGINYRISEKTITSYFNLSFKEKKDTTAITEIILGPKCKITPYDIQLFLSLNDFGHIPYKVSSASYR